MNGKVSPFARTTFVNNSDDRIIAVEERPARHTLGQLLRHFNQLDAVLNGKRVHLTVPNIDTIARRKIGITNRNQDISNCN